jgi:hypothetical protein
VVRPGAARTGQGRARQQNAQAELGPPRHPMIIHKRYGRGPVFIEHTWRQQASTMLT